VSGRVEPKMKLSSDKATYPYRKQVWRATASDGSFSGDVIAKADEIDLPGEPLLEPVMRDGQIIASPPSLRETQERAQRQIAYLPAPHKRLIEAQPYPVHYSDKLEQSRLALLRHLENTETWNPKGTARPRIYPQEKA